MSVQAHLPPRSYIGASALPAYSRVDQTDDLRAPSRSRWTETEKTAVVVISESKIFEMCFARCLQSIAPEFEVFSYRSIQEWLRDDGQSNGVLLLCAMGRSATEASLNQISQCRGDARIIIVSDVDDPALMTSALTFGAKGYVTMNADLEDVLGAVRLVSVGGCFVPASSFMKRHGDVPASAPSAIAAPAQVAESTRLTERQLEVLRLTRQGDPNKIIAYKLNLSQATVKVHLRNMMRKLKARNRIELILKSDRLREVERVP